MLALGTVEVTPAAAQALAAAGQALEPLLERHRRGDRGDVWQREGEAGVHWKALQDFRAEHGGEVHAVFVLQGGSEIMIITGFERARTRVLLSAEYEQRHVDIREGYAVWAETYDHGRNPLIALEELYLPGWLDALPLTRVLDVGAGTGRHALRLARRGIHVTAFDQSPEMLAVAQEAAEAEGLPVTFIEGSVTDGLPFEDGEFDGVVCALVLEHIPALAEIIGEFARVLQPGGHLFTSDLHPELTASGEGAFFHRLGVTYRLPSGGHARDSYLAALNAAGLALRQIQDVPARAMPPGYLADTTLQRMGELAMCLVIHAQKAS